MGLQIIASDLQGTQLGEVTNADNRSVEMKVMQVPTTTFNIPLNHYLADSLCHTDCLIRVYRTDPQPPGARKLIFHGPVLTTQEIGESLKQTIAVTAVGPLWRLTKRLIPGSDLRTGFSLSERDLGQAALDILAACNNSADNFSGIWPGNLTPTITGTIDRWYMKIAAEALSELASSTSSFEYNVAPTEAIDRGMTWPQIGQLNCPAGLGTTRPDVIFEYGTTRGNVASYERKIDRAGLLTHAQVSVSGWPDPTSHEIAGTVANVNTRGLFQELIPDNGIIDDTLRQALADYHIALRSNPREVITFKPAVNAKPSVFTDYDLGDHIRARAVVRGKLFFDRLFRIWGMKVDVDKNGNENVELELVSG